MTYNKILQMGPIKSDPFKQLITLTVITLSVAYCITIVSISLILYLVVCLSVGLFIFVSLPPFSACLSSASVFPFN
jgi:hypothetical protein